MKKVTELTLYYESWQQMRAMSQWQYNVLHRKRMKEGVTGRMEVSAWLFHIDSPFRQWCIYFAEHTVLETLVMLAIAMSSVLLAVDTPNPYHKAEWVDPAIGICDPLFLALFVLEFILKWFACGFVGHPAAYWKDPYNKVDFIVLVLSIMATVFADVGSFGRVLRTFRTLRPLRMINKSPKMKALFTAAIQACEQAIQVAVLVIFFTFLFSCVGLSQYMSLFWFCNADMEDMFTCVGTFEDPDLGFMKPVVWANPDYSFDNIGAAMLTFFEVQSAEGWIAIMHSAMDVTDYDLQPSRNKAAGNCIIFMAYILITYFIIVALLIGKIIDTFINGSGQGILTDRQRTFKSLISRILTEPKELPGMDVWESRKVRAKRSTIKAEDQAWEISLETRRYLFEILEHEKYDFTQSMMTLTSLLVLCMQSHGASDTMIMTLDSLYLLCASGFLGFLPHSVLHPDPQISHHPTTSTMVLTLTLNYHQARL